MPTEQEKAELSKRRGALASSIEDADKKKKFIARSADVDKDYEKVANETEGEGSRQSRESNIKQAKEVLGSFEKGGKVKKTGAYQLHEDEAVLPKNKKKAAKIAKEHLGKSGGILAGLKELAEEQGEKEDKPESKKAEKSEEKSEETPKNKHKFHRTEIVHHSNGSHTVHHHFKPSEMKEDMGKVQEPVSYAATDMGSLHAGIDQNLGAAPDQGAAK